MTYRSTAFTLYKGDNKTLSTTVKNSAGTVVDISAYEGRFTIKSTPDATSYILRKATSGIAGGADAQMKVTAGTSGIIQTYILKTDLVTFATATLVAIPANDITNDEGFTLVNVAGTSVVFKFSKDAGAVTGQDETISIATGDADTVVAAAIQSSIDGRDDFSAAVLSETVTITQNAPGTSGNQTNSDTVTDTDFTLSAFTGGVDTPEEGTYYYEVELQDGSGKRYTVLQDTLTLKEQLNDWEGLG